VNARRYGPDGGSATAELAVCLPALVLLLVVGLTAVAAVRTQLECLDAARDAALAAARGGSGVAAATRVAPAGATVSVASNGDSVTATVRARVRALGGWAPGIDVEATAVAAVEPGAAP
jgi:hypothetical protein